MGQERFSHMSSYLPEASARFFPQEPSRQRAIADDAGSGRACVHHSRADADSQGSRCRYGQRTAGERRLASHYMKRLSRDHTGAPLEFFESFYRPDKFEYQMTLSRSRTGDAPKWIPIS